MGELAAVATSILWAFTSIQFTIAGRRVGSQVVNSARLVLAVLFLSLIHLASYGIPFPVDAEPSRFAWLGASGVVGLVLGDAALLQALLMIGPRRAMLIMTLAPVITTVIAWLWLGEMLTWPQIAAILMTVGGVAWVVSEQRNGAATSVNDRRRYLGGILLALGGATGQALGLILAKQGLAGSFSALSATLIRMAVAMVVLWLLIVGRGRLRNTLSALGDRGAWLPLLSGAATGPVLGVWLSMIATQRAHVGIASTLMALSPIFIIPLEQIVFHEKASSRALVGTVLALAGSAIIFLA